MTDHPNNGIRSRSARAEEGGPAYSIGDTVEVEWSRGSWLAGEVIETNTVAGFRGMYSYRVLTAKGTRQCDVTRIRLPRSPRTPPVREVETSDEAASWERSVGTVPAPLVAQPRPPKPWRSRSHLDMVRDMSCCVCGYQGRCEAHHVGPHPMGRKPADSLAAPLCSGDHERWHATGTTPTSRSRGQALMRQWDGVSSAARLALAGDYSMEQMDDIDASAAEAAARVWAKALEERSKR